MYILVVILVIVIIILAIKFVNITTKLTEAEYILNTSKDSIELESIVKTDAIIDKYKDLEIEYMPISNRYYPKHKHQYIYLWSYGRYELMTDIGGCEYAASKKNAIVIYDKYLEMSGVTSQILKP